MPPASNRKEKKTYSLSRESIRFVEAVQKERKIDSASSALDELLREQKQAREMEHASAAITKYYDSLTEREMEEDRAWGKAGEAQFPAED
jgi:hypothetical protein